MKRTGILLMAFAAMLSVGVSCPPRALRWTVCSFAMGAEASIGLRRSIRKKLATLFTALQVLQGCISTSTAATAGTPSALFVRTDVLKTATERVALSEKNKPRPPMVSAFHFCHNMGWPPLSCPLRGFLHPPSLPFYLPSPWPTCIKTTIFPL